MQIKAISLFIASYLVISTVAAPTTLTPVEAVAANAAAESAATFFDIQITPQALQGYNPIRSFVNFSQRSQENEDQ
jgi:hypothetical protein